MDINMILDPIRKLFQDRTFVTALISAFVAVIVGLIPALEPYQGQIISVGVILVLLAAGSTAITAPVKAVAEAKKPTVTIAPEVTPADVHRIVDDYFTKVLSKSSFTAHG